MKLIELFPEDQMPISDLLEAGIRDYLMRMSYDLVSAGRTSGLTDQRTRSESNDRINENPL